MKAFIREIWFPLLIGTILAVALFFAVETDRRSGLAQERPMPNSTDTRLTNIEIAQHQHNVRFQRCMELIFQRLNIRVPDDLFDPGDRLIPGAPPPVGQPTPMSEPSEGDE